MNTSLILSALLLLLYYSLYWLIVTYILIIFFVLSLIIFLVLLLISLLNYLVYQYDCLRILLYMVCDTSLYQIMTKLRLTSVLVFILLLWLQIILDFEKMCWIWLIYQWWQCSLACMCLIIYEVVMFYIIYHVHIIYVNLLVLLVSDESAHYALHVKLMLK